MQTDKTQPMIPTGIFAKLVGVHERTLRIYDAEGILCPARNNKNRRLYTYNDLEKVKLIRYLMTNLALNLSGLKLFLVMLGSYNDDFNEQLKYIKQIAKEINIDEITNIEKTLKRGRKPKLCQI